MTSPEFGFPKPEDQAPLPPGSTIEELRFQWAADLRAAEHHKKIEDALIAMAEKMAFAVFDGSSQPPGGEIAANLAKDHIEKSLRELPSGLSMEEIIYRFREMFAQAHKTILEASATNSELRGIATTATLMQVIRAPGGKKRVVIANAGDSRVCILRKGKRVLEQITRDNTVYNDMLVAGGKTEEQIIENQVRISNVADGTTLEKTEQRLLREWGDMLSNGLGGSSMADFSAVPDIYTPLIEDGDMVLIFTDGVGKKYTDQDIAQIVLEEKDPDRIIKRLVQDPPYPDDAAAAALKLLAA
ncbi:MAG: protein phosphatase 2C domain-containing protein [Patescibacteria group bacterium]